ncbi:hypothetical protein [Caulobacter sp. S45]|uniref:hypothetical protein n=1 Tax=Caulobacter sp. S45 TaxID=1641861 RepID=UPI00157627C5|nr:hypothetical protein [Caulobacter sp. S45]
MNDDTQDYVRIPSYEQKVQDLIIHALLTGLKDEETSTAVLRVGEIVNVMLDLQAMMLADSGATATPTKTREFCSDFARRLQRKIAHAKKLYAAGHKPFQTVHIEGSVN